MHQDEKLKRRAQMKLDLAREFQALIVSLHNKAISESKTDDFNAQFAGLAQIVERNLEFKIDIEQFFVDNSLSKCLKAIYNLAKKCKLSEESEESKKYLSGLNQVVAQEFFPEAFAAAKISGGFFNNKFTLIKGIVDGDLTANQIQEKTTQLHDLNADFEGKIFYYKKLQLLKKYKQASRAAERIVEDLELNDLQGKFNFIPLVPKKALINNSIALKTSLIKLRVQINNSLGQRTVPAEEAEVENTAATSEKATRLSFELLHTIQEIYSSGVYKDEDLQDITQAFTTQNHLVNALLEKGEPEHKEPQEAIPSQLANLTQQVAKLKAAKAVLLCSRIIESLRDNGYWHERVFLSACGDKKLPAGIQTMRIAMERQATQNQLNWFSNPNCCIEFLNNIKKEAKNRLNSRVLCFFNRRRDKHTAEFYHFLSKLNVDQITTTDFIAARQLDALNTPERKKWEKEQEASRRAAASV
ncbi:MAG TPA: hypothetical protein VLH77_05735 [Gammaproteobacteria bacterium]|nr:hypothetical protein [Gammaproteobacteria bacterium]